MAFSPRALTAADVQPASSLDGLQELIGRLGYDVSSPVELTAASLGVAERFHAQVRRVRRLVAQEILPGAPAGFEIYAFEMTTRTAELRKGLAAAFRNKPARILFLVATRDYDPLDFVLVMKEGGATGGPVANVRISNPYFSVDRRQPSEVHLRVLGRMTATGADPYAQFDRVRDAFGFAAWSSNEFNNRNLFSDYFLTKRLTQLEPFKSVFHADVREPQRTVSRVVREFDHEARSANDPTAYQDRFLQPLLAALGFAATADRDGDADFLLGAANAAPLAALLVYPWDRPLDRQDDQNRDPERAEHVPGIRVIAALEKHQLPWAILTNGKDCRLYSAQAHSRASNYYEVDLPAALEREDAVAFRYFYLFFRAAAFVASGDGCFLDRVRLGSEAFAKEIGDRLRQRIFDEVFPYLAQGFVEHRKEHDGTATAAGDPFLAEAYDATLTLLYRLLFLLYAELLDLVPVEQPREVLNDHECACHRIFLKVDVVEYERHDRQRILRSRLATRMTSNPATDVADVWVRPVALTLGMRTPAGLRLDGVTEHDE